MDEGDPIPLVKIYGDLIKAPSPDHWAHEDTVVVFELVNIGTGPTTAADQVWASLSVGGTNFAQQHENLDSPPIEPNGGSRRFRFAWDGHYFFAHDDWSIWVAVTNAAGDIADEQVTPTFVIRKREELDVTS